MARIPAEKKSSGSILPWLLGIVALLGLVWLGAELFDAEPDADEIAGVENNVGPIDDAELGDDLDATAYGGGDAEMVTVAVLADAPEQTLYAGSEIEMAGMTVTRVVGDRSFYVESSESAEPFFVVLDQEMTPDVEGVEGRYDVNAGQTVDIYGSIMDTETVMEDNLDITEAEAQTMQNDEIYILAQRLTIEEAPMGVSEVTAN